MYNSPLKTSIEIFLSEDYRNDPEKRKEAENYIKTQTWTNRMPKRVFPKGTERIGPEEGDYFYEEELEDKTPYGRAFVTSLSSSDYRRLKDADTRIKEFLESINKHKGLSAKVSFNRKEN